MFSISKGTGMIIVSSFEFCGIFPCHGRLVNYALGSIFTGKGSGIFHAAVAIFAMFAVRLDNKYIGKIKLLAKMWIKLPYGKFPCSFGRVAFLNNKFFITHLLRRMK